MTLSLSCTYAIRAVVLLMQAATTHRRLGIAEIAGSIEANEHTTGKILQQLVREGMLHSVKGPNGGFYINPGGRELFLIEIVAAIDGTEVFYSCGLGLKACSDKKPCPIHDQYKAARSALLQQFSTVTIQQLALGLSEGKTYLKR